MFYAVAKGRNPGIYLNWNDCNQQVKGFKYAKFRKFQTRDEAEEFIKKYMPKPQNKLSSFFKVTEVKKPLIDKTFDYYVYTDGACSHNGSKYAKAGIGIYFGENDTRNTSERVIGKQTNNTAELKAIIKTFEIIKPDLEKGKKICIASDSEYSIKCATSYGNKMARDEWAKNIPNKELVKKIYELAKVNKNVKFKHVRAHTGKTDIHSVGNDNADILANEAIGLTSCPYS